MLFLILRDLHSLRHSQFDLMFRLAIWLQISTWFDPLSVLAGVLRGRDSQSWDWKFAVSRERVMPTGLPQESAAANSEEFVEENLGDIELLSLF